jgi:predicted permease
VVVISYDYWMRRLGGEHGAIGKKIIINDVPVTIIGVGKQGFQGEVVGASYDIWLPLSMQPVFMPHQPYLDDWSTSWLLLLGRLRPGATVDQARAELGTIARQTIEDHVSSFRFSPPGNVLASARTDTLPVASGARGFSRLRRNFATPLLILMAGVGLLLLIVCANVANLLLARAIARGREIGVRIALGAGRGRLVRQLLTESLVLGFAGAAGGLLVASWGSRLLVTLASDGGAIPLNLRLDFPVLGFTLVAVALAGLAPAFRASRVDLATAMRAQARAVSGGLGAAAGRRLSVAKLLIGAQVALSVVLLTGAALLVRSLRSLEEQPMGLDREHLLIVDLNVGSRGYSEARRNAIVQELAADFQRIPGVAGVTYSENGIFSGTESQSGIAVEGFIPRTQDDTNVAYDQVGPHYASAIGARLLQGRDLEATDNNHTGYVALVNESFARFYYPGQTPVGKWFKFDTTAVQIIGIINDVIDHDLRAAPIRRYYLPYLHAQDSPSAARFEIRTRGEPGRIGPEVRRVVTAVDAQLPIDEIAPLTALTRQSVRVERLLARLATGFGLCALLLAAIGLYGVMTYAVTRRTGEIGLRVALGARRAEVVALILGDAFRVVLLGFLAGLPLSLGALRLISTQLHGVGTTDPLSICVTLAVLLVSALIAVLVPTMRAMRISPIVALREE